MSKWQSAQGLTWLEFSTKDGPKVVVTAEEPNVSFVCPAKNWKAWRGLVLPERTNFLLLEVLFDLTEEEARVFAEHVWDYGQD
jgi:hypothetical protein